jgi:glutaredoxin
VGKNLKPCETPPNWKFSAYASLPKAHEEHQLPYEEFDIETDLRAAKFVKHANDRKRKVPTFNVDGRVFPCSPFSAQELERKLGL